MSVRQRSYSLRVNIDRKDEIGQLALAFNTMLEELAAARQREASEQVRTVTMQAELERAAQNYGDGRASRFYRA